jgi:glycosyltransferase involved in cell wall biosynthesis
MPKVSIIIQAYNSMNYLPKTLESVLKNEKSCMHENFQE